MTHPRRTARILALAAAPVALLAMPLAFTASTASAQSSGTATYMATLNPLNHASGSGTLMLQLNGDQAVITENVQGLARAE